MIFPPSCLHGHPCFRGKCKEKVSPKEAETETITEQYYVPYYLAKKLQVRKLFK